jgi:DNA-binding response OmpR family regulator
MAQVLIIEDELPRLRLLALSLAEAGHGVSAARTISEALGLLVERPVEAVILNTHISAEATRCAVEALRRAHRFVPIIDLTHSGEDTGADAYVRPPHGLDDVLAALRSALVVDK